MKLNNLLWNPTSQAPPDSEKLAEDLSDANSRNFNKQSISSINSSPEPTWTFSSYSFYQSPILHCTPSPPNSGLNIIIPLGGKGERFQKEGFTVPKPLIKIFDKEMIFYVLDNLNIKDEDNIYIIYHYSLDEYDFCNIINSKYPRIIFIKLDKQTLGAAETIKIGLEHIIPMAQQTGDSTSNTLLNKKCILLDCDTFYTSDILQSFRNIDTNAVFYVKNYDTNPIFSYISLDDKNKIIDIKEKIKISDNANVGIYCFNDYRILYEYCNIIIDNNIMFKNEYYTSCVIAKLLESNHDFYGIELEENDVHILGTPAQVKKFIENISLHQRLNLTCLVGYQNCLEWFEHFSNMPK